MIGASLVVQKSYDVVRFERVVNERLSLKFVGRTMP
jgi:hypothetical protein